MLSDISVAKLTPEEEEAALAAKERAEKAIVDAQLRSGVSVVLTNDFLLNAQKFILGLMFKEHTGKISHGQEEAAAATAEDTPSTSDDSTDSSSSTRAQWPVILNLIVPTDLDDFELLNARDFVVAARAQNMVISGMTEPEHGMCRKRNSVVIFYC